MFLGLAMPNQYCQTVEKEMWGWILGDIFGLKTPSLYDTLTTEVLFKHFLIRTDVQ